MFIEAEVGILWEGTFDLELIAEGCYTSGDQAEPAGGVLQQSSGSRDGDVGWGRGPQCGKEKEAWVQWKHDQSVCGKWVKFSVTADNLVKILYAKSVSQG